MLFGKSPDFRGSADTLSFPNLKREGVEKGIIFSLIVNVESFGKLSIIGYTESTVYRLSIFMH